jgi:hypothetical protein
VLALIERRYPAAGHRRSISARSGCGTLGAAVRSGAPPDLLRWTLSGHVLAASSGVVAAWVVAALVLLLLAGLLWSFLRRSGTAQQPLEVDRIDSVRPGEPLDDAGGTGEPPADGPRD